MEAIELHRVGKVYGKGVSKVTALHDVSFSAPAGQLSLVVGPSGSGKSTFLTIAGGLQTPTSGQVLIDGHDPATMTAKQRDHLRLTTLGFVLQSYNLHPPLTVADQFTLVDRVKKEGNLSKQELATLLAELGIADLIDKYPGQLSGGQRQRVAIARALYPNPTIVLADEPTAALDRPRVAVVGQLMQDLAKKYGKAVVVVTHDQRLTPFADRIARIEDGRLTMEK